MTRLDTRIVTALLARDSKDATYKFALLRAIVQCVTEQRAHKRIDENPFAREMDAGHGQGALSTREIPSTRKQTTPDDEAGRNRIHPNEETGRQHIHPEDGSASKPILPNGPYMISYPLGLLVYFWMFINYPIFAHRVFIPPLRAK
jgi:hypothetical protein